MAAQGAAPQHTVAGHAVAHEYFQGAGVQNPAETAVAGTGGFWRALTLEEQHGLATAATSSYYPMGTVLWREGDVADHLVVITTGYVRVSVVRNGRERIIAFRGPGDIIGERAALLLRRRSAGIVALDTVRTLKLSTAEFAGFLTRYPRVVAVLEKELYERMTEVGDIPADVTFPPDVAFPPGVALPCAATFPCDNTVPCDAAFPGDVAFPADVAMTAPYVPPAPASPELGGAYRPLGRPSMPAVNGAAGDYRISGGGTGNGTPVPAVAQPPAWTGQMCTIVYTDIVGFSGPHRTDEDRLAIRRVMYDLLRDAFTHSQVPWEACHREDRGDGALIVVPPEVPTRLVVDPMLARLTAGLRRHNRRSSDAVRIQLRIAMHVGPVTHDKEGVAGSAVIHTARLLDAPIFKDWIAETQSDLGVIASTFVYDNVIADAPGYIVPSTYQQVTCTVKESNLTGWMHLSSTSVPPDTPLPNTSLPGNGPTGNGPAENGPAESFPTGNVPTDALPPDALPPDAA